MKKKKNIYQLTIQRILKRLAVGTGKRSKEEDKKIKKMVYEAVSKEVLAFIWDNLDTLKRLAFKQDIADTKGDLKQLKNVISIYYRIIPNHRVRLEKRLQSFETALYTRILKLQQSTSSA